MAAKERLEMIRHMIKREKRVVVSELSTSLGVTEETIRRDLEKLENEGILNRTFGGAVLNAEKQRDGIHFYQRAAIHIDGKRRMAAAFSDILKDKITISADASTSAMEAVKLIRNSRDITLLTTSTVIFHELADTEINILSTGGSFNQKTLSLQGEAAKENARRYYVDLLLIGCNAIDMNKGIMDSQEAEAEVKKVLLNQASEVALFVDHSKFDRIAFTHLSGWDRIDYLVTDIKPDECWVNFCEENKIQLIY